MKEIKLGIGTYCYTYAFGVTGFMPSKPMTAFDLIDKAVDLNLNVVQISDNYPLHKLEIEELERLSTYAKKNGIMIEVGTRGIKTEHLKQYIKIANILQSKIIRVVIDTDDHKPDFNEIVSLLSKIQLYLKENSIVLGIENHDRFKSTVFAKIVETLHTPFIGIVMDTVNSFSCEENTRQVMDALSRYTINFHVKDFEIKRVPNSMGLQVIGSIAGQGFLNIPDMIYELREHAQSDFSVILEHWMPPEKDIHKTMLKENMWVEESIKYLKKELRQ